MRRVWVVVGGLAVAAAVLGTTLWAMGFDLRSDAETAALFPVTVHRSGGVAGVDDRAVVTAGGEVALMTRTGPVGTCRIDQSAVEKLADLADDVRPGVRASSDVADGFIFEVESGRGTKTFRPGWYPDVVMGLIDAVDGKPSLCR